MSEVVSEVPIPARTAGGLLRAARQAHGLHIAALAATIKVSQRKLESLEADRFEELPDATFTRALAQTVCRALKMDPAPVLALLPAPVSHRLEHVSQGINEPFRERDAHGESTERLTRVSPGMWAALAIIVMAAIVYLLPQSWLSGLGLSSGGVSAPGAASSPVVQSVDPPASATLSVPGVQPPAAPAIPMVSPAADPAALPASAIATSSAGAQEGAVLGSSVVSAAPMTDPPNNAATGALPFHAPDTAFRLRAQAPSWVEVRDANSRVLLARLIKAGEEVTLDAPAPLRVKIGNARSTQLTFRGKPVDLAAAGGRDNVARLELK